MLARPAVAIAVQYVRRAPAGEAGSSPQRLHIELLALRDAVPGGAVDLAASTITSEHGQPFRGASPLPPGSRWLAGDAAQQWVVACKQLGPEQLQELGAATVTLTADLCATAFTPSLQLPRLSFETAARPPAGHLALRLQQTDAERRYSEVQIEDPFAAGPAVLFVAAPAPDLAGYAWVLMPDGPATADELAQAAAAAAPAPPPPASVPTAWRVALASVGQHNRRPALLALAEPLRVPRVVDVLLVADERALADITQALAALDPNQENLGWPFERALWTALLPRLERNDLPGSMQAALVRHLGAIADDSTTLRSVLQTAADGAAFVALLRDANIAVLDDHDAGLRYRGHDWLAARGATVPGYQPFASPEERRRALRQYAAAATPAEGDR